MSKKTAALAATAGFLLALGWTVSAAQSSRTGSAGRNELTITFADGTKQVVALRQSVDKIARIEFGRATGGGATGGALVTHPTTTSPLAPYAGAWDEVGEKEGFVQIVFKVQGNQLVGTYEHDNGRITGTMGPDGKSVVGKWTEEPSRAEPNDAGNVKLVLSADGRTLTLHFAYGESDQWTETVFKKAR